MEDYLQGWKEFANFSGRTKKKEFWMFILINLVISTALSYLGGIIDFIWISSIFSLVIFIPTIAIWVRRMRDIGKAWYFMLIPFYNLYLATLDSVEQQEMQNIKS